jgi:osmoprotectant transport system substrate-binding protein
MVIGKRDLIGRRSEMDGRTRQGFVRRARLVTALLALAVAVTASFSAFAQSIVIGGKNFTEQLLMAEMTRQLLRSRGFAAEARTGFGTGGLRQAQEGGQIDVYWEYTGTSLVEFNKVVEKLDEKETYARVKELDARKGLVWLDPSKVNNTYALAMRRADAAAKGIASISDLAARVRAGEVLRFASNAEFYTRSDGLVPLQRTYGFEFAREHVLRVETNLVYQLLRDSKVVDVGLVFVTDGRIPAFDLVALRDDKLFFPSYTLAPVVRKDTLEKHPELAEHLNALSARLDDGTMARLNGMIDVDKRPVEDVAASFLKAQGLL